MSASAEGSVELHAYAAQPETTVSSISYQLAHETARQLEARGEYALASEVLALALAEEAQRINQQAMGELDLAVHAMEFKGVMTSMAQQQQHFA